MADDDPVTRESLNTWMPQAPVSKPAHIPPPEKVWSDTDWTTIRLGHTSGDMDDKWNAFVEGSRLYLHRSWTGHGIYESEFSREERGWRITEALVTNDCDWYRRGTDEYESLWLETLIDAVLLGRQMEEARRERLAQLSPHH
jgi:hypothetical protein